MADTLRPRWVLTASVAAALVLGAGVPPARAEVDVVGGIVGGVGDILTGALSIPMSVISGTLTGPPIIGTIGGALRGILGTIGYTTRGAMRLVGVSLPVATSLAPFLPFVL